jgi:hypothetical protein
MDKTLTVTLTRSYKNEPLATVHNLPGPGADLYPVQMRALAAALINAANECEARPMGKRSFVKTVKMYSMELP